MMRHVMNLLMWLIAPVLFAAPSVYQYHPDPYPQYLASKPKDSIVDSSNNYNRECTSYASYKIKAQYRVSTHGWGDAKYWLSDARARHIPVGKVPRVGAIGVSTGGLHGHVFYVEAVYGDGLGLISQYNADGTGHYSVSTLFADKLFPAAHNLNYIYFN